jgi:trimethylamine--corrinoid protein Co-methyltransferase
MRRIIPQINTQLSDQDLQRIHTVALSLISETGVLVREQKFRKRFEGFPGCRIKEERLCFDSNLVEGFIEEHRHRERPKMNRDLGQHPKLQPSVSLPESGAQLGTRLLLLPYDYASHIVDLETDDIRPISEKDLVVMTKLVDALHEAGYPVLGGCPGFAQDLPEPVRAVAQYKIGAQYSRTPTSVDLPTIQASEFIFRMMQVMGEQRLGLSLFMFNPLRVDEASLERILYFLDCGIAISVGVGHMPLLGATTPISLAGALAQSAAEILAGFTMMRLIAPEVPVNLRIQLFAFDMRFSNIALGAPEECLLARLSKELTDFYGGLESPNPYIFSSSILPNQQTATEKAATALYKALSGVRTFTVGGATASGVFSPEQLVIDCEIIDYANRIMQGFELGDPFDELGLIQEGIDRGLYLDTDATASRHRATFWKPRLFEHFTLRLWQETNPLKLQARAKAIVYQMIGHHTYRLEPGKWTQLEAIYTEAFKKSLESDDHKLL